VKSGYSCDPVFSKVLDHPEDHKLFTLRDGLLWHKCNEQTEVLCVPCIKVDGRALTEIIINEDHTALRHLGMRRTLDYVRRWYW
ncbi:uncharacterized protein LAESUDRAFT_659088, partial [Laetiporus sulphureus 93-53]